jgi:predicted N-acetyltransferase YhbS
MIIRQEQPKDHSATEAVIEAAFKNAEFSDKTEHELVRKLRRSDAFIPELSLVAEIADEIVGHILFTKITIADEHEYSSLALAPMALLPQFQNKGIGRKLILKGLERARELGFESVIVLGHENYYPKFGFKKASLWGISAPFPVPDKAFMALELRPNALKGKAGIVRYAKEFGIE